MKHFFLSILSVLIALSVSAATESKTFALKGNISSVVVSGGVKVEYTVSSRVSLTAYTEGKYIGRVKVSLKKGTLNLGFDHTGITGSSPKVKIVLSCPAIGSYTLSGGADIDVLSDFSLSGTLNVTASGGADMEFSRKVSAGTVSLTSSGGSDVDFDGALVCNLLKIAASGGSDIDIPGVKADSVAVSASGGSDVDLSGNARSVSFSASGAGEIDAYGLVVASGSANASGASTIKCNVKNLSSSSTGASSVKNRK